MGGAAPHGGRRKDTQGRLCGRGGSGAGRSEAGQRRAPEEPDLRQLPGPHPPQPRPPGPGVLPPSSELLEAAQPNGQHGASRGSSMRWSANRASCSTAFLPRCARKLRARPRRHSGLGFLQWKMQIFSMFLHVFWAVPLNTKNGEEGHPRLFSCFWGALKSGVTKLQK